MSQKKTKTVALGDIIMRYDLYPRLPRENPESSQSEQAIESYKVAIEDLPPITINQDNILVNGWHRWEAYKRIVEDIELNMLDEEIKLSRGFDPSNIEVEVRELTEDQILLEATKLNARGNVVMSRYEKRRVAERLCDKFTDDEVADALGIPRSTVNYWTKEHREMMKVVSQELVFKYADKYPDMKLTEIRDAILENEGVTVPRSTHSDWLRDRKKIEASWREPEDVSGEAVSPELGAAMEVSEQTYEQYVQEGGAEVAKVVGPPDSLAPAKAPDATLGYICDGYAARVKGITDREYLQTGCLRCKNMRSTGTVGFDITLECGKGHKMVVTGLKRDK